MIEPSSAQWNPVVGQEASGLTLTYKKSCLNEETEENLFTVGAIEHWTLLPRQAEHLHHRSLECISFSQQKWIVCNNRFPLPLLTVNALI